MKHGDLSNEPVARLVLVFEGALGFLPGERVVEFNRLGSLGRWYEAAQLWDLDPIMIKKILDVTYRQGVELEVVTYAGPKEFAAELEERFAEEHLPIRQTKSSRADIMARVVSYAPDIAAIYDANPETAGMYGRKGKFLKTPHLLGR